MGMGRGSGINWEMGINTHTHTHTHTIICKIDSGNLLYSTESSAWCSVITRQMEWEVGREVQDGGYMCTCVAVSLRCTAVNKTTL